MAKRSYWILKSAFSTLIPTVSFSSKTTIIFSKMVRNEWRRESVMGKRLPRKTWRRWPELCHKTQVTWNRALCLFEPPSPRKVANLKLRKRPAERPWLGIQSATTGIRIGSLTVTPLSPKAFLKQSPENLTFIVIFQKRHKNLTKAWSLKQLHVWARLNLRSKVQPLKAYRKTNICLWKLWVNF